MKTCCTCKKETALDNFYKNKSCKDGLSSQCKSCQNKSVALSESKNRVKYASRKKEALAIWKRNNPDKVRVHRETANERNRNNAEFKVKCAWRALNKRCNDKRYSLYSRYGERGIKVEWNNYEEFNKDMLDSLPEVSGNYSIERINNDGNYKKSNCRWATTVEQANNRHTNVYLEHEGRKMTIAQWARHLNVNYKSFHKAIKYQGKTVEHFIK
jgi:hypothetical protein